MTSVRKQATQSLKKRGFTRQQASNAWYNQKQALKNNTDLRGRDLRQQTYGNIALPQAVESPVFTSEAQLNVPVMQFAATPLSVARKQVVAQPAVKPMTFAQAFRDARNKGLKVFDWNGKSYNTGLASESLKSPITFPASKATTANAGEIIPSIVIADAPDTLTVNGGEIAPAAINANKINPNTVVVDTAGFVANHPSIGQKEKPWTYWDVIFGRR